MKVSDEYKARKKRFFKLILFFILLIILIFVFIKYYPKQKEQIPEEPVIPKEKTLSELQIAACNAADKAKTCDSRLVEVGIVSKGECCEVLGKCC